MLYVKLPRKTILASSLKTISNTLKEPLEKITKVYKYASYVDIIDGKTVFMTEGDLQEKLESIKEKDTTDYLEKKEEMKNRIGDEGLLWLAEQRQKNIPFITEIDISSDIFETIYIVDWSDLCCLCARIERHAERWTKLNETKAPEIIMRNESRILDEMVSELDNALRSSSDDELPIINRDEIGYSIVERTWEERHRRGWNRLTFHLMNELNVEKEILSSDLDAKKYDEYINEKRQKLMEQLEDDLDSIIKKAKER